MDTVRWRCLSNHGQVLVALGGDRGIRIRDIALRIGLTERAVQRIINELVDAGLVERAREGRRNLYTLLRDRPLPHVLESHRTVGDLIDGMGDPDADDEVSRSADPAGPGSQLSVA